MREAQNPMGDQGRGRKKLSVARELYLLAGSMDALRLAAHQKLQADSEGETLQAFALVVAGSLHVFRDRVRLIERILLGATNPSRILCPENEAALSEKGPGIIEVWSPEEEASQLAAEWRGARHRANVDKEVEEAKDKIINVKVPSYKKSN